MEMLIILLLALAFAAAMLGSRLLNHGNPFPFTKRTYLFTQVERSFQQLLEKAVGQDYKIVNRVKLADMLELRANTDVKTKRSALIKLNAKYIDYVLVNAEDLSIVAAIDLVNNTSAEGHKAVPDWFVGGSLEASGIPYVRMKIKAGYTIADIQQGLAAKLGNLSMPAAPLVKGTFKKGPTRPVKPLMAAPEPELAPLPALTARRNDAAESLKLNAPALVRIS